MARTELPNGVILPAEYSDDWYEDMISNLTKLDDVIGSDSEKLNADGVNFLRMSSAALTDGGTGNFSDLNSSYKIKTGDLILDSGRKLYQVVSVDSTNETFTVGNSLFKVTAESDLAPVAESGDYDDLNNKPDLKPVATSGDYDDLTDLPTYGITRFCSSAITDNSSIAFSAISSTNKIKVGDFLLDINGKMYQISAVDTTNQTVTVGTALVDLALDANVVHTSGNETVGGVKTFDAGQINVKSTIQEIGVIPQTSTLQYMPFMDKNNVIHGLVGLWDYDNGASEIQLNISDIFKNGVKDKTGTLDTSFFSFGFLSTGVKFTTFGGQLNNSLIPLVDSTYDVGSSSYKWKSINGLEPSSLSMPDLTNAVDISGYITDLTGLPNVYSPPANGYIVLRSTTAYVLGVVENTTGMGSYSRGSNQVLAVNLPVVKNSSISIYAICSSLTHAKFIPCQGNI